ncbi:hypothetical protein [Lactiplantibacillus plantarum]|uniref:hypothetical protein n=1 Tax=Lactiplantibacillus plantarum TaxID=1590 RepID=UPI0006BD5764|nr:hypothetical protein [Lactiplantibacillus plantarum]ALC07280.1 acetyltransferase (GNAT) family [Lactiplantibacillus plantarum]MDO7794027.1 hypothetical protein [Lactiplantibacillus plantarum]WKF83860.1 hypothetical protein QY876_10920 [Lactiplantibacillus plantarum]WKF89165.1 hypothetical protein QY875_11040 [Lactiplantibacillus plantarum]
MALTYRIVRVEANSDFGKIRQLYYETWQSAYRDLMPASYLQQLTPTTWRPERRWQNMLLVKLWVFAHLVRPDMQTMRGGANCIRYMFTRTIIVMALVSS